MELSPGQWLVIGISALLILGYIRGYYYNRQRAEEVLSWLHAGLESLGPVSAGGKLPGMATGGRLEVKHAASRLRRAEAVYLLAPRENLFFWLFHRLQGKDDELILWLTFQAKPGHEVEVARRGDSQFEKRLKESGKKFTIVSESPRGLVIAASPNNQQVTAKVQTLLHEYAPAIQRLSLRENKPHLFLRANLHTLPSRPAAELLAALIALGGEA
ncbi:MAG: hypothetical protein Fur0043_25030 [Anaerolineales bacterium]